MGSSSGMTAAGAEKCLQEVFGYSAFRPGQLDVISAALAGEDCLTIMPTGAGKSLCYQLPSVMLPGLVLVISPLIALMKDQVDGLNSNGRARAAFLNSSLHPAEQQRVREGMEGGAYDIVYVAPERLRSSRFLEALEGADLSLLVVDEAHCVSHWGHDFRPDYLHIADAFPRARRPTVLAVTATAPPRVREDVRAQLGMEDCRVVALPIDRPNLELGVRYTPSEEAKLDAVRQIVSRHKGESGIIYCGTRAGSEQVAAFVDQVLGVPSQAYHAGVPQADRAQIQESFMAERTVIVAATNAFGMGIDKENIRLVLHLRMPDSLEAYFQEAGRAGRDGRQSECTLLYDPEDRALLEWFATSSEVALDDVQRLWDVMWKLSSEQGGAEGDLMIAERDLSGASGLKEIGVARAIELLCAQGPLLRGVDRGREMALRMKGERIPPETLTALDRLSEARQRARRTQLRTIIEYAETNACRRQTVLAYFGERLGRKPERCCDNCSARAGAPAQLTHIDAAVLDCLEELLFPLGRARVAEILTGSQSKPVRQLGLDRLMSYGVLRGTTQAVVVSAVDEMISRRLLKLTGADRPVLAMTPEGIRARQAADTDSRKPAEPPAADEAPAAHDPADIDRLILECIGQCPFAMGRVKLADVLVGSNAKRIKETGLDAVGLHGALKGTARDAVVERIDSLIERGLAEKEGDFRPVVVVTAKGAAFLRDEAPGAPRATEASLPEEGARQEELHAEPAPNHGAIAEFLLRPHPRPIRLAYVDVGLSMDANSRFRRGDWERTQLGELVFQLKYRDKADAADELAGRIAESLEAHAELTGFDLVAGVPPSSREEGPDCVSRVLCALRDGGGPPVELDLLEPGRERKKQKDIEAMAEKRLNVAQAFRVRDPLLVAGKTVLLIDDLVDSGATLNECARELKRVGAERVLALALTRTIHHAG